MTKSDRGAFSSIYKEKYLEKFLFFNLMKMSIIGITLRSHLSAKGQISKTSVHEKPILMSNYTMFILNQ